MAPNYEGEPIPKCAIHTHYDQLRYLHGLLCKYNYFVRSEDNEAFHNKMWELLYLGKSIIIYINKLYNCMHDQVYAEVDRMKVCFYRGSIQ